MDPQYFNTIPVPDNPSGPVITMDLTEYIPKPSDPSVPLPPGLTVSTIERSIETIHPIHTSAPLVPSSFPSNDAGVTYLHAFERIAEFFSHGFHNSNDDVPLREDWLVAAAHTLVNIHNSIRRANLSEPLPAIFTNLDVDEHSNVQLIKHTLSSLSSFFSSHLTEPSRSQTCMRCLEECNMPVSPHDLESILMSCDQNIRAAHSTIINDALRKMHTDISLWADKRSTQIQDDIINALCNEVIDQKVLDADPHIQTWANTNIQFFRERLRQKITKTASETDSTLSAWVVEAADVAFAKAAALATEQAEATATAHYEKEMARLLAEANSRIAQDLVIKKSQADAEANAELSSYKHNLKIETDRRKDNADKAAVAAVRKTTRNHPQAPILSSSSSRRSRTNQDDNERPSRDSSRSASIVRDRSRSLTPRASPAPFNPPSQVLTEPLTEISVGPPSNSFEEAMLEISSQHAPPSDPTETVKPIEKTVTNPIPDAFASFFSQISSQISNLGGRFDTIEHRLLKVEQQHQDRYSPSAPQPAAFPPYDHDIEMPHDLVDDNSEYAIPTTATNHEDELLFLENIYRNHYNLNDIFLPTLHRSILDGEVESLFNTWLDTFRIDTEPKYLTATETNGFFVWRLGHIENMANTPSSEQQAWIAKRDAIRAATGATVEEQAKSGPGNPEVAPVGRGNTHQSRPPAPPRSQSPIGWFNVQKGGKVKSFAAAAATTTTKNSPSPTTPNQQSRSSNTPAAVPVKPGAQLTRQQVEVLTKQQIISLLGSLFSVTVRDCRATKPSLINLFLSSQSRTNPVDLTSPTPSPLPQMSTSPPTTSRPRARPANQAARFNTEFTVLAHPDEVATHAKKQDPAAIVRTLRTAINQVHGGRPAEVTLLTGRWSSRLSHNFVLTFAGKPTNDQVYRYRAILTSPFGTAARIIPQHGFTKVVIHSVPVERDQAGDPATTMALINELRRNPACEGLTYVNPPQWFTKDIPFEKRNSSITLAFIDEDGTRLQQLICNPPSLFGGLTRVEKYNPLPVLRGCERCHALDHSIAKCPFKKGSTICPLCGGNHKARDHNVRCTGVPHGGQLSCNCPPRCINCERAGKPGKGHTAPSPSCPLRKLYRKTDLRTGDSSEEERPVITRMEEDPVPSSQPVADGVLTSTPPPPPTPAHVDDVVEPFPPITRYSDFRDFARAQGVPDNNEAMKSAPLMQAFIEHIGTFLHKATPAPSQ